MNKTDEQLVDKVTDKVRLFIKANDNEVHIHSKVGQLLDNHAMTQMELMNLTGIPQSMISGFVSNRPGVKMGYHHIMAIAEAFNIDDISEILEIRRNY